MSSSYQSLNFPNTSLYHHCRLPISRGLLQQNINTMKTTARDIAPSINGLTRQVSNSLSLSSSPAAILHSPPSSYGGPQLSRMTTGASTKQLKPFATEDIKILLLENVNETGRDILAKQGYQVEFLKSSLAEEQLIEKIRYAAILSRETTG